MTKADNKYFEAVGRRKTSVARVRITPSTRASFIINDKDIKEYLVDSENRQKISQVLNNPDITNKFKVTVKTNGGGINSQTGAIIHGLSRAIVVFDSELRKTLKKEGYLKRDPRMKERRKFGLKKARKAPQWSKR